MGDEQQLDDSDFGIRGIEKNLGYSEMPLADAKTDDGFDDAAARHYESIQAPEYQPQPTVERAFYDVSTGEPRDPHETVSAEDAARQLSHARQVEYEAVEAQKQADIAVEADALRGTLGAERLIGQEQPAAEAQPEAQPQPEQVSQPGSRLEQVLRDDPQLLGEVKQYAETVRQHGEQAVGAAAAFATWNAQLAAAAVLSDMPELQGLTNEQIPTALQIIAKQNPQRAAEIKQKLVNLNTLAGQAQQAQKAQAEAAQQRFWEWSQQQDNAFDRAVATLAPGMAPEKIRAQAIETLRNAGISDQEMRYHYNNSPLFRSAAAQTLMAKAAAFDLMMQEKAATRTELAHKRVAAAPHVQRPGVSSGAPTRTEAALAEARSKLRPSMNAKEAAEYLIARRAAAK